MEQYARERERERSFCNSRVGWEELLLLLLLFCYYYDYYDYDYDYYQGVPIIFRDKEKSSVVS